MGWLVEKLVKIIALYANYRHSFARTHTRALDRISLLFSITIIINGVNAF